MSEFELKDEPPKNGLETSEANINNNTKSVTKEDAFSILENQLKESEKKDAVEIVEEDEDNTLPTTGSVPLNYYAYQPISNGLIPSIPKTLHYKKLDVIETLELSSLEFDLLDEQITSFLNGIVLEDFDHLSMPEPDRLAVMLFYIAKNTGVIKNDVKGICEECEEIITIPQLDLSSFESKELPKDYKEPYFLKLSKEDGTKLKIGMRIATAGDTIEANKYIEARKLKDPKLKKAKMQFLKTLAKTYSIGVAFKEVQDENGKDLNLSNEDKIKLFAEELTIRSREYIALYYQKFSYGTDLETKGNCSNSKCPSRSIKDEEGNTSRRAVSIAIPFQKSFFALTNAKERTLDEVAVH